MMERDAHLSKETWEAIATMTGRSFFEENMETYKSQNENQREEYDMCQALREIREDFFEKRDYHRACGVVFIRRPL